MGDNGPGVGDALDGAPPEAGAVQAEGGGQDAGPHVVLAAQSNCKKIDYHYYVSRGPVLYRFVSICMSVTNLTAEPRLPPRRWHRAVAVAKL